MSRSIGQLLAQTRQERSLSLEKVAQETFIRLRYLQAIEDGDLEALPSAAQARGFMRAYAGYLGLELDTLLAQVAQEAQGSASPDAEASAPDREAPEDERPAAERTRTDLEPSEKIFAEIGSSLRKQRELLGFSLEDVEQHTRVKTHYLAALEDGALAQLPSPVQGRGMLNNYSAFLGLDPDPLLLRFAEGLQARLAVRQSETARTRPAQASGLPPGLRRLVSGDLIFGGLLILGLAVFVLWGAIRITTLRNQAAEPPTAPALGEVLLASPSISPTEPAATATATLPAPAGIVDPDPGVETPEPLPTAVGQGAVQVSLIIQQRAWVRVTVDGQVEFEGRVIPGSAYSFAGEQRVEVLSGNAAALQILYNQQDLGVLGITGEVVNRVFTLDGVATPTATATPTITATARTTPTPAATASPPGSALPTAVP